MPSALACTLLLAVPVLATAGQDAPAAPSDEEVRRAWACLTAVEQRDVAMWMHSTWDTLETFQTGLVRYALSLEERDPGFLPDAPPTPVFECEEHAPGQIIPRRWLAADGDRAESTRARMFRVVPEPTLRAAYRYEWGTGEVQRVADPEEPELVFENALAGYPPWSSLAQALVERALDDGQERALHAAFGHAYTDRTGNVFPGVTLYDAWNSNTDMEMPDVDVLGIYHGTGGARGRYVAPIPATQHDELYAQIAERFERAKRHRGLRTALAMCYVAGSPRLRDGYAGHLDRLHALWNAEESTPAKVAALLPAPDGWAEFLQAWSLRADTEPDIFFGGRTRRATLDGDGARVRALLVAMLRELGAFEREARPAPGPPAPGSRTDER